jgi:hypothetical protein
LGTGLAVDTQAPGLCRPYRVDRGDLRHVHDQQRNIQQLRQAQGAIGRLGLGDARMAHGMEHGSGIPCRQQLVGQPTNDLVVLRMNHRHGAMLPREREDREQLVVVEPQSIIGHVDLERGVAVLDQRRQLLPEHLLAGIEDDEVEGVVDDGLRRRQRVIVVDARAQQATPLLHSEGDDRRGAAERGSDRAGIEIVRGLDPHARFLLDVDVAVDAAGQDQAATRIDLLRCCSERLPECHDLAAAHADIAVHPVRRRDHRTVSDDKVELGHCCRKTPCRHRRPIVPWY